MPDLRTEVVSDWLDAVRPAHFADAWPPPVRPIEASSTAGGLMIEFGQLLDQLADTKTETLSSLMGDAAFLEDIQTVLAQVGAARTLAFFHWLRDVGLPNHQSIENALLDARSGAGRALFASVTTVARQATLQRLISIERMDELASATDAANQESPHE
ncbi:MAG: hypothetical protein KGH75_01300 [Rhodospirillales bacterium]|nr:hypothetical protein [Rhodospirillales bacterium]